MGRIKISDNFYRDEFRCLCGCGFDAVDKELLEVVEDVREHFNSPVFIVQLDLPRSRNGSACRCLPHNRSIGSNDSSMHVRGKAADIKVDDVSPTLVYEYLIERYPEKYGIGLYLTFVHIDVRESKARWGN